MRARLVFVAVSLVIVVSLCPYVAEARPRPARTAKKFQANKGFGLGLMLGVPTGITGKYYLSKDTAIDFAVGSYGRYRYDNALAAQADFLWHPIVIASPREFWVPLYFGIGARILAHQGNRNFRDDTHLGVRVPVGISMDFNRVPIDLFFEVALVVDLLRDANHGLSDFNSSLGARYYFN